MDTQQLLDHRIGMMAVQKGIIAIDEYQDVLKEQKRLFLDTKKNTSIMELFVQRGYMTEKQKETVLLLQRSRSVEEKEKEKDDILLPDDPIEEIAQNKEAGETVEDSNKVVLTVSDDAMEAYITLGGEDCLDIALDEIKKIIAQEQIKYGLVEDDLITGYLQKDQALSEPLRIAQGKIPEPGKDDKVKYYFDTDPFKVGTLTEKGNMDWKNHGDIPQVKEEELLAEIVPGCDGKAGMDVFGRPVEPQQIDKIKLSKGKGVEKSEDGLKFYAKIVGTPQVSYVGELSVSPVYEIDGDVGIETGHIEFFGHIEVKGTVHEGYRVKGKSLRADEIAGADIDIEDEIIVIGGIFNIDLKTAGSVKAHHIHRAKIYAKGDVSVGKEIIDCEIETGGKCTVDGGRILSSEVSAKKGIQAGDIGSDAASPSILVVGIDEAVKKELANLRKQKKILEKEEAELKKTTGELKERSEEINIQLGDIAQVQDKHVLQKRELMESSGGNPDKMNSLEKKRLDLLEKQIGKIDEAVDELMTQDEEISASASDYEDQMKGCEKDIIEVQKKMVELNEASEKDPGAAIVQVSGEIFPGNRITGPHASVVVDDIYRRAMIREVEGADSDSRKRWSMSISTK